MPWLEPAKKFDFLFEQIGQKFANANMLLRQNVFLAIVLPKHEYSN